MNWDDADRERLALFLEKSDNDEIRIKELIKHQLLSNRYIIHALNDTVLEPKVDDACRGAELYYGTHIVPYFLTPATEGEVTNIICYEVSERKRTDNPAMKNLQIIFTIWCNQEDIEDGDTGVARHDLIGALIQDQFNYTNMFGNRLMLTSNMPSASISKYSCRTLVFEQIADNNLVKTHKLGEDYVTSILNKTLDYKK